ncbi:hypothetical protein Hanom_Chr16g01465191 [Helianthus anomalus]
MDIDQVDQNSNWFFDYAFMDDISAVAFTWQPPVPALRSVVGSYYTKDEHLVPGTSTEPCRYQTVPVPNRAGTEPYSVYSVPVPTFSVFQY